jgi:glycosyltransferase involved in cell wall biosynthesis
MIKKIVFVNKNYWSFYNFRLVFAQKLIKRFKNISVLSLFGGKDLSIKNLKNIKNFSFPINQTLYDIKKDIHFIISLRKFIKKENPKVIHFFNPRPMLLGNLSTLFLKKKINIYSTVTGLGHFYLSNNYLIKIILFPLFFIAFKKSQVVFFQNRQDRDYFKDLGLLKNVKTFISFGQGIKIKRKKIKKINYKKIKIGFVARLTKEKGFEEYLESVEIFKEKNSEFRKFVEFGFIKNFDKKSIVSVSIKKIKKKLNKLKIKQYQYKANSNYLNYFDVIVYPSYREGCSKTLMEACNYGKVIITTDVPGCNNIIKNNFNGMLASSKNANSLTSMYEKIFTTKNKIYKMQKNAQSFAYKNFDEEKVINSMIDKYKNL